MPCGGSTEAGAAATVVSGGEESMRGVRYPAESDRSCGAEVRESPAAPEGANQMRAITAGLALWFASGFMAVAGPQDDLDALNTRVEELYANGDYAGATKVALHAVKVAERQFGKDAVETGVPINNLAGLYESQGKYAEAEPLCKRALAIAEKAFGPDHPNTAQSLTNLAGLYQSQAKFAEAEPLCKRALAICEKALGPDHPDTAQNLNDLAELYGSQAKYGEAEPLHKRALEIFEKVLGPDHPYTATSLTNLAGLYQSQGKSAEAEPLCKRALAIAEKALGPDHPDTAQSLNNLAEIYRSQGRYTEAEPLCKRALAIYEKALGPDHPDTAQSLNNLAEVYGSQGRYAEAEPLFKRALAIYEKALGPDHPDTAQSLNDLAELYLSQARYSEAEALQKRVLAICEKALGPDHPDTATSLNNLAGLYESQGRYAEAEPLYKQSLGITEKAVGLDHPDTATRLHNLAGLYQSQGEYVKAEPLYKRALAICENALGPDHPDTAGSLNSLAEMYCFQGKYAEAEPLLRRALAIREKALGADHPETALSLNNVAVREASLGRYADAANLIDRSRRGTRRHVARVLPSLSAAEQAVFLQAEYEASFHGALTLGVIQESAPQIASLSAGWLANGKSVGQEAASQQIIVARQSENPATAAAVAALTGVRGNLGRLAQMTPAPEQAAAYRSKLAELQAEENRLVHEIGGQLAALDRDEPWVEIDAIRKNIPAGSVLVDIARFYIYDFAAKGQDLPWQPARYAAWIAPPAGAGDVTIVDLGDAAEIDALVAAYRGAIEAQLVNLDAAGPLAARVLRPILAALPSGGGKVEELILSPDGALWLVPWQALPLEDGSFAIERYAIRTLTSARDLVPPPADAAPKGAASPPLLVADPAFDEAPSGTKASPGDVASAALPAAAGRVLEKVDPLPATRREAEAALAPLEKVSGVAASLRVGREATAAGVEREAVRPKVLVLATHGFFLPDQEVKHDERRMLAGTRGIGGTRPLDQATGRPVEDPLLRCGLLFTGANLPAAERGGDDGVLTGAEIVGLDLLGTELVVLSACETGVGRVDVGEGVAGLRQAFQIAGAKSVVATLWQVPDEESSRIMTDFYAHLAAGQPASRALRTAQLDFLEARRKRGGTAADHPYFWAAYGTTGR
jgi:tetratricopeptide (TPR) repeat protein/CHAT domain-containing protein